MKKLKPDTEVVRVSGMTRYYDTRTAHPRKRWWTKARIPGTVRATRKLGGSGFRNNWEESHEGLQDQHQPQAA